tara:strand:+ start:1676 stop:1984 length:309 start_codon:yes stop_codon:yes gene_type:complete
MEKRKATIADALVSINPEIKFTYRAEDYNRLKILSDHSKPTKAEIDSEIVKVQAQFDSEHYKLERASQYPSIQDQLDMLYHQGIEGWKAEIKKVKDAHPKPE